MLTSYCKCEMCKAIGMNKLVYYNEQVLVPMQFCDSCLEEFDKAMSEVEMQHDIPWWAEDEFE